jgi:RNA polymerase sigma-70 factor (ECF subfamily)
LLHEREHINDEELLEKFYTSRDNRWLGILLQRYALLLLGVCMKYLKNENDARDCTQQIFLQVINELEKYRVTYFKSWIYTVTRNYCLMQLRGTKGKIPLPVNESLLQDENSAFFADRHIEKETMLTFAEESLQELNDEQRICVSLFYLEKKSYRQICEQTGYSLLQVKSFIQNGKRNLKALIEKKMNQRHG